MDSAPPVTESDFQLVQRVAARDEAALEELVNRHKPRVLSIAYRFLGDSAAADDLAQEVFLILWNKAQSFRGESAFSTWLYRVVVNECLQSRRKRRTVMVSLDSLPADRPPESLQFAVDREREARIEQVRRAIAELPDRQRIALVLAHYEGRSYEEVAEIMGASLASVRSLILRAKDTLRGRLRSVDG